MEIVKMLGVEPWPCDNSDPQYRREREQFRKRCRRYLPSCAADLGREDGSLSRWMGCLSSDIPMRVGS
jgi:hypothetical protein